MILETISIAQNIAKGIKSGAYPTWQLTFIGINSGLVTQSSLQYIAKLIQNGYTFGELIEDKNNGYWELTIDK